LVGDPITKKYPNLSKKININDMKNIINFLNGKSLSKVIFISTCSNYGIVENDGIANEETILNPLSDYAKAKVEIENYILLNKENIDYSPTILRFATAFGLAPRMRFDLTVNEFTRDVALGKDLVVFDADTWRPYCHVKDFASIILNVLNSPNDVVGFQVFNSGSNKNNSTKRGIIEKISKHVSVKNVVFKNKGADTRNYRVDFSKIKNILNFEPIYDIEYGIKEIINALENKIYVDIEHNKNYHGNYYIENGD